MSAARAAPSPRAGPSAGGSARPARGSAQARAAVQAALPCALWRGLPWPRSPRPGGKGFSLSLTVSGPASSDARLPPGLSSLGRVFVQLSTPSQPLLLIRPGRRSPLPGTPQPSAKFPPSPTPHDESTPELPQSSARPEPLPAFSVFPSAPAPDSPSFIPACRGPPSPLDPKLCPFVCRWLFRGISYKFKNCHRKIKFQYMCKLLYVNLTPDICFSSEELSRFQKYRFCSLFIHIKKSGKK